MSQTWRLLGLPAPHPRCVLAASTGGHLAELIRIADMVGSADDSLWITFDTPQSRSLLAGRDVLYVPHVGQRDLAGTLRAVPPILRAVRGRSFDLALSTGAAIAVAALLVARAKGVRSAYVESFSRTTGPSLSGRILALSRGVALFTQDERWANGRWRPFPSVLASYRSVRCEPVERPRIVVSLGTLRDYPFDALVDAVLGTGLANEETVWQLGATPARSGLPGEVVDQIGAEGFGALVASADVLVAHAGAGTLLQALAAGVRPILIPRRAARGEHIDDHQEQICQLTSDLGIAATCEVRDLTADLIRDASGYRIQSVPER